MSEINYTIKQAADQRWGIYLDGKLLATIGSYEACESVRKYLQKELSYPDHIKSKLSYRNAIDKNLLINSGNKVV